MGLILKEEYISNKIPEAPEPSVKSSSSEGRVADPASSWLTSNASSDLTCILDNYVNEK